MKTVNIDDEQHEFLAKIKDETGVPIAVQVRKALAVYIVEYYSKSKSMEKRQGGEDDI